MYFCAQCDASEVSRYELTLVRYTLSSSFGTIPRTKFPLRHRSVSDDVRKCALVFQFNPLVFSMWAHRTRALYPVCHATLVPLRVTAGWRTCSGLCAHQHTAVSMLRAAQSNIINTSEILNHFLFGQQRKRVFLSSIWHTHNPSVFFKQLLCLLIANIGLIFKKVKLSVYA
jgi:hypothetical protein